MAPRKKAPAAQKKRAAPQSRCVRNLRNVHVSLKAQGRRIELAPRGQRKDVAPLEKGDQADEAFMADKGVLFEIITKGAADKIAEKQATNQQEKRHPALDVLRTAEGEKYSDDAVKLEERHDQQGKVVANLSEEPNRGKRFDWGVDIRRADLPGTQDRPLPDMPDSVAPEDQGQYRLDQAAEADALADEQARNKNVEGPAAGLGGIRQVTKGEVQRN